MRLCQGLLCDEAAVIWFRGPWCAACALKRFGRRDIILAARFSELHEASRLMDRGEQSTLDREDAGVGFIPLTRQGPPSEGTRPWEGASAAGSLVAAEPPPISDQELDDLLETEGWSEWEGW